MKSSLALSIDSQSKVNGETIFKSGIVCENDDFGGEKKHPLVIEIYSSTALTLCVVLNLFSHFIVTTKLI